jgi:DNA-binding response OmpR family regulator
VFAQWLYFHQESSFQSSESIRKEKVESMNISLEATKLFTIQKHQPASAQANWDDTLDQDDKRTVGIVSEIHETMLMSAFVDHGLSVVSVSTESPEIFCETVAKQSLVIFEGVSVARAIKLRECLRDAALNTPIIATLTNPSCIDEVLLLELGFDDVTPSAVEARVVVARARATLRRIGSIGSQHNRQNDVTIGRLRMDFANQIVKVDGTNMHLTSGEFDALRLLAKNVGRVVSRSEIALKLTGRPTEELSRMIDCRISRLRKKLFGNTNSGQQIRCVRNKGYLLVGGASS